MHLKCWLTLVMILVCIYWRCLLWKVTWEKHCVHWSLPRGCARWNWVLQPGSSNQAEDCVTNCIDAVTSCYHPQADQVPKLQNIPVQLQSCLRAKTVADTWMLTFCRSLYSYTLLHLYFPNLNLDPGFFWPAAFLTVLSRITFQFRSLFSQY